jgi:hypothetical protein
MRGAAGKKNCREENPEGGFHGLFIVVGLIGR